MQSEPGSFNRLCAFVALLWLAITIPVGIVWRPTVPDFGQFYLGGLLARQGHWDALYPIPKFYSLDNPGLSLHSYAKPNWREASRQKRIRDYTHFILPPPSALLFAPLSLLEYRTAFWVWTAILTLSAWGTGLVSARLLRIVAGQQTRLEGILILLIALSPITARAIRIANVSPPVALFIGLALLSLLRPDRPLHGALAILGGALLKYATLILAPLVIILGRWRTLLWIGVAGFATLLLTLALAGLQPFQEFREVILPTLSRPSLFRGNQSLPGLLARIFGRPLPADVALGLTIARIATLAAVFAAVLAMPNRLWKNAANVLAAAGLLLSWLLVFSPIAWEHWPIFLCPVWGWLLWEARLPGANRILALAALFLMYFPAGILQVKGFAVYPILLPEPWNSTQLLGVVLLMALSFRSLLSARVKAGAPEDAESLRHTTGRSGIREAREAGMRETG